MSSTNNPQASPHVDSSASSFESQPPRPSSPAIQVEAHLPHHPHKHFHSIRIPSDDTLVSHEDEISPPPSISAHVLTTYTATPVPSTYLDGTTEPKVSRARSFASGTTQHNGTLPPSQSRRKINQEEALINKYNEILGRLTKDGKEQDDCMKELRSLARAKGIPSSLRKSLWPMLLSCHIPRSRSLSVDESTPAHSERLVKAEKRIRGELSRHHRRRNRQALPTLNAVTPSHTPSSISTSVTESTDSSTSSVPLSRTSSRSSSAESSPRLSKTFPILDNGPFDLAIEATILDFLTENPDIDYSPQMVYVCITLAEWILLSPLPASGMSTPTVETTFPKSSTDGRDSLLLLRDTFVATLNLMGQLPSASVPINTHPSSHSRQGSVTSLSALTHQALIDGSSKYPATHRISKFLTTFRTMMPDLAAYFDEEGVGGWSDEWVSGWVGWFCAKEMSGVGNDIAKARLYDIYFAWEPTLHDQSDAQESECNGPGEELHLFICLALLKNCADALEELEQSEIRTLLQQLPLVEDVECIIKDGTRLKSLLEEKEKKEEEDWMRRREAAISNADTNSHSSTNEVVMSHI